VTGYIAHLAAVLFCPIMSNTLTNPTPQFGTAEYAGVTGAERCKSCSQSIGSQYYRVNGALTCSYCGEQAKLRAPQDSHQTFVRGLLFGIGGAVLGLIIYAGFGIITGLMLGYISLAVGYIVGKAIMKGTNGLGGRRYQIAAVALTYAAVSLSAIPIGISQIVKHRNEQKQNLVKHAPPPSIDPGESTEPDATAEAPLQPVTPQSVAPKPKMSIGSAIGMLTLAGLASPFLELQDPLHGAIGLIILFVGIRIAWKLTAAAKLDILGPFSNSAPAKSDAGS
jgi:hypothetical protein